jgi:hypothetical protein
MQKRPLIRTDEGKGRHPPAPPGKLENAIKVTMDGSRLQIVANVDAQGADKLIKAIEACKARLD